MLVTCLLPKGPFTIDPFVVHIYQMDKITTKNRSCELTLRARLRSTQTGRDLVTRRDFQVFESALRVPESKFWKLCEPGESKCFAAVKYWKILHQEQLCWLLKTEKSRRSKSHPVCFTFDGCDRVNK